MRIDLYDFDKTVYPTDSTMDFWLYCLVHYPWILIYLPVQTVLLLLWGVRVLHTGTFKSLFLRFIAMVPTRQAVCRFWDRKQHRIYPWFEKAQRARYTVVISASPDFLLEEICRRMQVDKLICTKGDPRTGKLLSKNCKGEEKVRRLDQELPDVRVDTVYSDSLSSDAPIFALGIHKINTVGGKQIPIQE